MVYATWNKPIVVLCNQNSFSNAEIFSHAIKTLKRGQLVGVPTAGGVISTGGTPIMDVGFLRMPSRGWYTINDGEDMELHGAVPDHIIWPQPGEMPAGKDLQLNKAVEVLLKDVDAFQAKPRPKLKPEGCRRLPGKTPAQVEEVERAMTRPHRRRSCSNLVDVALRPSAVRLRLASRLGVGFMFDGVEP
jgi:C-terminal processing protease CtpA/Prc